MKAPKPNPFGSITSRILANSTAPQPTPTGEAPKDKITSVELKGELRQPLDRVMHGLGKKKGTLKNVINDALAYYFENEPKAKRLANTPTPDEENDND